MDGRGNLSNRALTEFCEFFLNVCLDQARYMDSLLTLDKFLARLEKYAQLRSTRIIPGPESEREPLRAEAGLVLRAVATGGEVARGEAFRLTGIHPRMGTSLGRSISGRTPKPEWSGVTGQPRGR